MRVREQHTFAGKPIQIGSLRLRMTAEATDPIVEIVNGNEKHVAAWGGGTSNDVETGSGRT